MDEENSILPVKSEPGAGPVLPVQPPPLGEQPLADQMAETFCVTTLEFPYSSPPWEVYQECFGLDIGQTRAKNESYKLLARADVQARLTYLRQLRAMHTVAGLDERKEILTEMLRESAAGIKVEGGKPVAPDKIGPGVESIKTDALTGEITGIKMRSPTEAIQELNRMDGVYKGAEGGGGMVINVVMPWRVPGPDGKPLPVPPRGMPDELPEVIDVKEICDTEPEPEIKPEMGDEEDEP
jgi:hypothetical protein